MLFVRECCDLKSVENVAAPVTFLVKHGGESYKFCTGVSFSTALAMNYKFWNTERYELHTKDKYSDTKIHCSPPSLISSTF